MSNTIEKSINERNRAEQASHKLAYIMQREGLPMDAQLMSAVAAEIEEFWNKRGDTTMTNETIMGDPVMSDTEELKPCPFCGEDAEHREFDHRHPYEMYGMLCDHDDGCYLSLHTHSDEYVARWDNRLPVKIVTPNDVHLAVKALQMSNDDDTRDRGYLIGSYLDARTLPPVDGELPTEARKVIEDCVEALQPFANFRVKGATVDHQITMGSFMAQQQLTAGDCVAASKTLTAAQAYIGEK